MRRADPPICHFVYSEPHRPIVYACGVRDMQEDEEYSFNPEWCTCDRCEPVAEKERERRACLSVVRDIREALAR